MNSVRSQVRVFNLPELSVSALALTLFTLALLLIPHNVQAQMPAPAIVYSFQGGTSDFDVPSGVLAQGRDGNLYGTAYGAGANHEGGVYVITPAGTESLLVSFPAGWGHCQGLVLGLDGNFYGTCQVGGLHNDGFVFQATPSGVLTDIYDFTNTNNDFAPASVPVLGANGNLYGTTGHFGANCGNIYRVTTAGVYKNVKSGTGFCGPWSLSAGSDGNFYGTWGNTPTAGNRGAIFKISAGGGYSEIFDFTAISPSFGPINGVILASNGKLYGNDNTGGAHTNGAIYSLKGTTFVDVHDTNAITDGNLDTNNLFQASNGNFYGASFGGGSGNCGTFAELTSANAFSAVLLNCNPLGAPSTSLAQHTDGTLYGATSAGFGNVVSFNINASPFISLVSPVASGAEGTQVQILGQGFDSSSVVKFGGTTATTATITGSTFIQATVPAGALTGKITVTTGATTLSSVVTYKVKPTIKSFAPASGAVGASVVITGTGLAQTTAVKFNGKAATFTIKSDTQITATVPTGATTGKIAVTTKGGSVSSATTFTVN